MKKEYLHILMDKARGTKYSPSTIKSKMSAKKSYLLTEAELKRLNSLVRNKKIDAKHFANTIFKKLRGEVSDAEINNFANDHFTAAYYSFLDLKDRMIKENCFDYRGIKKYGYLINLILFDLLPFANHIGKKVDDNYYFFNGGKSNIEDSRWHYLGTLQLLYNCSFEKKMLDNKFAFILSAVSLRQTIELKIQRVLGVGDYFDLKGEKIFTNHYFFFDFILDNKIHFDFANLDLKIIKKILEFCNNSVHKGVMPYYWQMYYAIRFCDSLFYDPNFDKNKKSWHIHSATKILNYEELKIKLENKLKKCFPDSEYELHILWIKPEAEILS